MISFENVSKQYGAKLILDRTSFSLSEKERTGLIGSNGSGKTTLLRMLHGGESLDSGVINMPGGLSIGYLPQEVEVFDRLSALEIVLSPFRHLLSFMDQMQSCGDSDTDSRSALSRLDHFHAEIELHDAYSLQARAEAILDGLGISASQRIEPIQRLSGGFRMRALLGKLLLIAPDFLLLDEPTNHLDMDSLIWLEKYLLHLKSGMLIVSHDRDFLNRITTCTAGIDNGRITVAAGNYDHFMRLRAETEANAESRARNISIQIAQNERFIERFRAKATKATQAQSRIKLIEKLRAEMPALSSSGSRKTIRFSFPTPQSSGSVPVQFMNICAGYDGKTIINDCSLSINRGDKIAIIGPNGSGKSTLLKLVAGILEPMAGKLEYGCNVVLRYFGQHQLEQLDPEASLYDTVIRDSVCTEKTFVRNILGAFLFSDDAVEKKVSFLSGGEKARVVLATLLASPGNVLLLDEPTNHLDLESVEMLSKAMADFQGTMVFVSHDEYFISKIANRIIEMRPGSIRDYPGTLADYRYYLESIPGAGFGPECAGTPDPDRSISTDLKTMRIRERESRKRLLRSIEKCEHEIAVQEAEITRLEAALLDPAHACDHLLLSKLTKEHEAARSELERLMVCWEEKQMEYEGSCPSSRIPGRLP